MDMHQIAGLAFLVYGILFSFFLPGYCFIESWFAHFDLAVKIPLYAVVSILISVFGVYMLSLVLGWSRLTIMVASLPFLVWSLIVIANKRINVHDWVKHKAAFALALFVFCVFVISLLPGIFTSYNGAIVMSASNWQDTAMHMGIIESIAQGNFPPQAPYFSGVPLSYYYFSDLHVAILETLYGSFAPRLLVFVNSAFAALFVLSVYGLTLLLVNKRSVAFVAAILAMFTSNFIYLRFISDFISLIKVHDPLTSLVGLLASGSYSMEYRKFFQMSPMVDYFLENRPMLVGLPSVIALTMLMKRGLDDKSKLALILAGVCTAILSRFQMFGFAVSVIIAALLLVFSLRQIGFKQTFQLGSYYIIFGALALVFVIAAQGKSISIITMVRDSFSWGAWDKTQSVVWYVKFCIGNLGLPFVIAVLSIGVIIVKRVRTASIRFVALWFLVILTIPHVVRFTIYEGDMFKFYYFVIIPQSILTAWFVITYTPKKFMASILAIIIVISSFTAVLTLVASYSNKNVAYSFDEYDAGMWIRSSTAPQSVFLTSASVHTPTTQIGGRLRVLSYINWPYSHGFNVGPDNVFSRLDDIESIYQRRGTVESVVKLLKKYNIDYVYIGNEEQSDYPNSYWIATSYLFELVYSNSTVSIYKVVLN